MNKKELVLFILNIVAILMGICIIPIGIFGGNAALIYGGSVLIVLNIKPTYKNIVALYRK